MLLDDLKNIVGRKGWSTSADVLDPHLTEWRDRLRGSALIMVSPNTTQQVAQIVQACASERVAIVPQGGNTGLCGGAIPDESGQQVLLSLARLNAIRAVDANDFSMVVEAGCILSDVQRAARDQGRFFPLSLAAEGSCQIGGNLSTNAGGINVLRYGTARQLVLGLEVVLADGTVWNGLRSLRKDTAGYDMKQVFLGSEGTLGVITAATLKLYPEPGETATLFVALDSAQRSVDLLARVRESFGDRIQAFELISDRCLRFVARHIAGSVRPFAEDYPWFVLCELVVDEQQALLEDMLGRALEHELIVNAIIAKSAAESESLWRLRHSISEAQKFEGGNLKHDIAVPIGRIGEFLTRGDALLASLMPTARLVAFGHVGDGNLHYNIAQPADADAAAFMQQGTVLTDAIYELVADMGGSISAEHGIGVLKKAHLKRYRSATELALMQSLKMALDPQNILNPGKVI